MTTAMQRNKYTDEELQNVVDHKEEKKTNEQITSNNYQDKFQKTFEMNVGNKRKGKWNSQIRSKKFHKNNLLSNNYLTYKHHNDNEDNYSHTNKSYSDLESKQLSLECEYINEDHVQNEKHYSENTDIDRNLLEHYVITIDQSQNNKSPIDLINKWALSFDGTREEPPIVSYLLVAISGHKHGIMYTYLCQVNEKKAKGEGLSEQEAKQNAAAQMLKKHFKVLEKNPLEHNVITTVQPQKSMTPISLINDWAMKIRASHGKPPIVSYTLVAITKHAHRLIFTYMCRVNDKTAKGEGQSKKEAKQNAAAQMWEKLFKVSSTTNNDKVTTSTKIADNFEVNENYVTNLSSTEGSQIINETDPNIEDEQLLQHSNSNMVKIAYCNINPVGALQEIISTAHNSAPPVYNFEEVRKYLNKNRVYKKVSYKVTCQVFHLKTTGTARTKKNAKRLAASQMIDQIRNIGEEKLNTLKS